MGPARRAYGHRTTNVFDWPETGFGEVERRSATTKTIAQLAINLDCTQNPPLPSLRPKPLMHLFQQSSRDVQGAILPNSVLDDANHAAEDPADGRGVHTP